MSGLVGQNDQVPSVSELKKELRALKRKLALTETNLLRSQLVSNAQERAEMVLSTSLKKELQFFKLVLENATNILLLLDFDGRFAYASRAFLAEADIPSSQMINGRHFQDVLRPIISPENLLRFTGAVDNAVAQKSTVTLEDQIDFGLKGSPRTFSIFITPMTDEESGKSTGIMALFNDITEINDAMETAKRANLAKSDFLANMSHEIRTPLNAITGMSTIAQSSDDIDKIHYCLNKINDSSNHLLGVINDILDMSKIEANHFELSFSEFVFEKMLLRTIDVMRFKLDEKNISFELYSDPAIPYAIYSDEQRLTQVIMNLLSNAVKFTPEFGSIKLYAEVECMDGDDDCTLLLRVEDSGIGISEEQKPRLFKTFSQADSSISRKFGGTGLGLAISKSIINLLGGDIWLESEEGKGTTFIFNMKTTVRRHLPETRGNDGDVRILVIDSSPKACLSFSLYAEKLNVHCTTAASTGEALDILRREQHSIIFLDWDTAGEDKLDFIRRLKDIQGNALITAMIPMADWSEIEKGAKNAGVGEFVSKPVLLPAIEEILDKYRESAGSMEDEVDDDFSDKTILLADDVEINRIIVDSLLEYTGVKLVHAENGIEAVEMYSKAPDSFDLIFMDVQMPEMDGYEATRRIRALAIDSAQKIPIVAMTANVFKEDVERCLEFGMNDHIGKPVNIEEIIEKIKKWTNT